MSASPPDATGPALASEQPPAPPELPISPQPSPWGWVPLGLDHLGLTQAVGGLTLGLIALFSSYDHLTLAGRLIPIPQQWGIPLIAASVATIFVDAQLASGSRLRAAQDAARVADERARERNLASEERQRADRERKRGDRERKQGVRERKRANRERYRANRERHRADQERHRANQERDRANQERDRADQERHRSDQERHRAAEARERQAQDAQRQNKALDLLRRSALLSARVQLDPSAINQERLRAFLSLMAAQPLEGEDADEA